jgi:protein N-terminal amidase
VTSRFCAEIAKKLQCHVFAGYPEALSPDELDTTSQSSKLNETDGEESSTSRSAEEVGANSAVLYGLDGEWIGGYRKTHLFETDKTWAKAGTLSFTLTLSCTLRFHA